MVHGNARSGKNREIGLSPVTPPKVQKLQEALHAKAKGSPAYRFYAMYDKVYRGDVLAFAYSCSSANGGAPGVDGQTFADIEPYGLERCQLYDEMCLVRLVFLIPSIKPRC